MDQYSSFVNRKIKKKGIFSIIVLLNAILYFKTDAGIGIPGRNEVTVPSFPWKQMKP